MSNVKKPEPLCYRKEEYEDGVLVDIEYNRSDSFSGGRKGGIPLVPVAQVEAYKDACVREALEQLAEIAMNAPITMSLMGDDGAKATAWHISAQIRALIPKRQPSSG